MRINKSINKFIPFQLTKREQRERERGGQRKRERERESNKGVFKEILLRFCKENEKFITFIYLFYFLYKR